MLYYHHVNCKQTAAGQITMLSEYQNSIEYSIALVIKHLRLGLQTNGVEAGDINFIMVAWDKSRTACLASPRRSMAEGRTEVT